MKYKLSMLMREATLCFFVFWFSRPKVAILQFVTCLSVYLCVSQILVSNVMSITNSSVIGQTLSFSFILGDSRQTMIGRIFLLIRSHWLILKLDFKIHNKFG